MLLIPDPALDEVVPAARALETAGAESAPETLQQHDRAEVPLDRRGEVPPLGQRVIPSPVGALRGEHRFGRGARLLRIGRIPGQVVEGPAREGPVRLPLDEEIPLARRERRERALPEAPQADVPAYALIRPLEPSAVQVVRREMGVQALRGRETGSGLGGTPRKTRAHGRAPTRPPRPRSCSAAGSPPRR